ncbi:MAG: methylated-DNA--[protein]-cysteine S-methyltransferase [Flavobacteriales bacterium]|nr:methylated-DNA--[protein]-cysteine S-methyltransferase [Flavobacteriales bacterium]MBK6946416.1 methylated-DNA--[protein]-cysteine S-methyltransferase [Flavobacteriales bacterium]MBK7238627.1 methylated-DNA--[protein]-cysteine S-methyltransferase [Flavobacteriales bacterium]MBK9536464.1 methylated-DNA--[protein]-cysteine S-methyltransferase [Flavobacteriales bacterium]MBP9137367.1 methylated-DNA--[protein]-cysteine S-methyltransferase [Flavobacteriales bacterium]
MSRIITQILPTPFGELLLGSFKDDLCLCDWRYRKMRITIDARIQRGLDASFEEGDSPVIEKAIAQLQLYFRGERTEFDLPLSLVGTDFQCEVWQALRNVPYGSTWSYSELTSKIAEPTAVRAVAYANGANAISIIIPCHRIIGGNGALVGYAGGLRAKKELLELEGALPKTLDLFSTLAEN